MDDAFLRAIRADPEADLPRLVYADWLDEHDDPARAEFVRVQCELATLPDHDDAYAALEDREHELLAEHESKWLGDGPTPDEWTFRRGFVDEVRLDVVNPPASDWLTRQAVTSLTLTRRQDNAREATTVAERCVEWDGTDPVDNIVLLIETPGLEGWGEVDAAPLEAAGGFWRARDFLGRWDTPGGKSLLLVGVAGLAGWAASLRDTPVARRLRRLRVGGTSESRYRQGEALNAPELAEVLRDAPLETLVAFDANLSRLTPLLDAKFTVSLTSLDVSYNPLGADAYRDFAAASPRLKLKHLDVSGTPLCGPTLRNLLASRCCETLTGLAINNAEPYLSDLLGTPYWGQAVDLSVHRCGLRTAALRLLAESAGPPGLRSLDLGDNSFGPNGVRDLCAAQWARPITWLNLAACALNFAAVWHLAQHDVFPYLRTLHLGHNNAENAGIEGHEVGDDAVEALVNFSTLARLRILTLTANPVTDAGVELLMAAPHFTLSGLGLCSTRVTAAGVRTMAKSPRLARLNWLDLSDNAALHSDALLPLAESPYLSPLCDLDISRTGASAAVRDLLRQRLGRRLLD